MPVETKKIKSALIKKGFVHRTSTKHDAYHFRYNGKDFGIFTIISRGSTYKEYGDSLMSQMRRQLKFDSKKQLDGFIECSVGYEEYVLILRENGSIKE